MERIIKFRCWNGEQMISPDYIDRKGQAHWKENSIPSMSKELMQFTGWVDKNGVEVYEGDIISYEYKSSRKIHKDTCTVIWRVNGFYPTSNKSIINDWAFCSIVKRSEIIGNIHSIPRP